MPVFDLEMTRAIVSGGVLLALFSAGCALFARSGSGRFVESFDTVGALEEAGKMEESASEDWWLNSGGRLGFWGGVGSTIQGDAADHDRWRLAYAKGDALDTDGGAHPQNLFRLVTRRKWRDLEQTLRFRIRALHRSESPNRNESNGVLLFHRYQNGDNLYYAGLRVDGAAVIKKKQGGKYTTLAYAKVYDGQYDRANAPSLLPLDRWIGLRTVIKDEEGGGVRLAISIQDGREEWREVARAIDRGEDGAPIREAGYAGIRTDFADVEFDDFAVTLPGR